MILFLIGCVFIGIILAFIAAPIVMVIDRLKLSEMDRVISRYHQLSPERRAAQRIEVSNTLLDIKNGIWSGDKQAVEAARDKLGLI